MNQNCISLNKVFHIFIAFYLLLVSIGVDVHFHICGGQIYSVGVFVKAESCMKGSGGCKHHSCGTNTKKCSDERVKIVLEEDFTQLTKVISSTVSFSDLLLPTFHYLNLDSQSLFNKTLSYIPKSPPPLIAKVKSSFLQIFIL